VAVAVEPSARATVVDLTIPAKAEYITLGRLALTGLARSEALGEEALSDLKLALSEACSNSIRHAYRDGRDGVVEIRFEVAPDRVVVEVADDGNGFVSDQPAATADDLNEGGLGIAIIRAVSDEFEIGPRADGTGLRLRFAKRIDRTA
jgi:serine/threonine-protein kinase RsbW